jgi:hypothetical protein
MDLLRSYGRATSAHIVAYPTEDRISTNPAKFRCFVVKRSWFISAAPKGGSCGGMNRWKLAVPERERFGLVYALEHVRHLCRDTIHTTHALPPLPLQHLG